MNRLLHKPLKAFALYALILLLGSIPVYVLVMDHIWNNELDENNKLRLEFIKSQLDKGHFNESELNKVIENWSILQPDIRIEKLEKPQPFADRYYSIVRSSILEPEDEDLERFRGLESYFELEKRAYRIRIETNIEELDETFAVISIITLSFLLIMVIGFVLLNRKITKQSWRPFYQSLQALKNFELSKGQNIELPETDILEFQELHHSIEEMAAKTLASYQQQKSFIENASHELQTPLALLKSKIDLLSQKTEVNHEVRALISAINAPMARLSRINKNLLVLAKVESDQFQSDQNLNLKQVIDNALLLFEDYLDDKELQYHFEGPESTHLYCDPFLVETLIQNLLSNAIRHSINGSEIWIKLQGSHLEIANEGQESLDTEKLFQRFSRNNSSDKVNSGLGLAIVKEIAHKYHWQVSYSFESSRHIFRLDFS